MTIDRLNEPILPYGTIFGTAGAMTCGVPPNKSLIFATRLRMRALSRPSASSVSTPSSLDRNASPAVTGHCGREMLPLIVCTSSRKRGY
jgi:hypothetical protein